MTVPARGATIGFITFIASTMSRVSPSFTVSPGERIEAGETLLIIEAMKVMNQITAPHAGTVTRILVQNAEPVEFGQPLVIIE